MTAVFDVIFDDANAADKQGDGMKADTKEQLSMSVLAL